MAIIEKNHDAGEEEKYYEKKWKKFWDESGKLTRKKITYIDVVVISSSYPILTTLVAELWRSWHLHRKSYIKEIQVQYNLKLKIPGGLIRWNKIQNLNFL